MYRRIFLMPVCAAGFALPALAQDWPVGTVQLTAGAPPDQGKWRVNPETNEYESRWRNADWSGYGIVMTNGGYVWVNGDSLEMFEVAEGNQLGG